MRHGRAFPLHPVTHARPFGVVPSLTLSLSTVGHLTISGKVVTLSAGAVPTKVSFAITQAWNNALWASQSSIGWAVHKWDAGTQTIGAKIAEGTSETTDASGVIEATTTAIGSFIGDTVIVTFWKLAGGPSSEDIFGNTIQTLVSGP